MKRNALLFVIAAALCAAGAYAQDQAPPSSGSGQSKGSKKATWEEGVKTDCQAEIADGGICAGKDFSKGLEKCLHQNKSKLSPGCAATVHKRRGGKGGHKKGGSEGDSGSSTPAPAPAPAQ